MKRVLSALLGVMAATPLAAQDYHHFDWQQAAPGVWFGLSRPGAFQSGNVAIITLPTGGSLVVDTQNAPFLGREIIAKARAVGHGPVRFVVNTHLHQDHVGGNAAFLVDNPKVQIIAHDNTCKEFATKTIPRMEQRVPGLAQGLQAMQARRDTLEGSARAALDYRIEGTRLYLADAGAMSWAVPTQCLDLKAGQEKIIRAGNRRIEIRYFGKSHSTGDLVVYLPHEKVAVVGDLWGQDTGFDFLDAGLDGRDGDVLATPGVLKQVRKLDFRIALTGHSPVIHGKGSLDHAIDSGEAVIDRIRQGVAQGKDATAIEAAYPLPTGTPAFVSTVWNSVVENVVAALRAKA